MCPLTRGQLAKAAEVNSETVRYYERRGLLPEPQRRESGHRQYQEEAVTRLRFIKRAKALGFTLDEIGELLALRVEPGSTCGDVRDRAQRKLRDVEEKIRLLQQVKTALTRMVAACENQGPVGECPILEELESL